MDRPEEKIEDEAAANALRQKGRTIQLGTAAITAALTAALYFLA